MEKLCMILPLALILCFMVGCQQQVAEGITEEQAKVLADRSLKVWNEGNLELLEEYMAPDVIRHEYGVREELVGIDAIKMYIAGNRKAFPDLNITIDKIIVNDDMMVWFWTYSGTNTGPFWDDPATGRKVILPGVTIVRVANGKAVEIWDFYNTLDMMEQVGFTLTPPQLPEPSEEEE
jgi:steroid delta-isomerase-like uncharacterized protein